MDDRILKVHGRLGIGSQGEVFQVEDPRDGRSYALKRLNPDAEISEDLKNVWRVASLSGHSGFLAPIAWGTDATGRREILLPLVRRVDGHALVHQQGPPTALSLLAQVTVSLSLLHGAGFCHRDLKPDNILIEQAGGGDGWHGLRTVLSDLDLVAPIASSAQPAQLTGSLGYLAPELLSGGRNTPASDLFALGMWLYWLISGEEPLRDENPVLSIARTREHSRLRSIGRVDPRFAGGFWEHVLSRLTAPVPQDRPRDGGHFLRELAGLAAQLPGASEQLARILWNHRRPLDEEARVIAEVANLIDNPTAGRRHVTVRLSRPETCDVAAERWRTESFIAEAQFLIVRPGQSSLRTVETFETDSHSVVVLDDSRGNLRFSSQELKTYLDRLDFLPAQNSLVVVLESASHRSGVAEELTALGDRRPGGILTCPSVSEGSFELWLSDLFGGIDLDAEFARQLERRVGSDPRASVDLLERAVQQGCLTLSNGKLYLDWHDPRMQVADSSVGAASDPNPDDALAHELHQLVAGLPLGMPSAVARLLEEEVPGFARTMRTLHGRGVLTRDERHESFVSRQLPAMAGADDRGQWSATIASRALDLMVQRPSLAGAPLTTLAFSLYQSEVSVSTIRRAIACARFLLYREDPVLCLSILHAIGSAFLTRVSPFHRGIAYLCRARALWTLGELNPVESAWDAAETAFLQVKHHALAARAALEARVSRGRLSPGFTGDARAILDRDRYPQHQKLRERLALEELYAAAHLTSFTESLRAATSGDWREPAYPENRALLLHAKARRAEESLEPGAARKLHAEAISLALEARVPAIVSRVVALAAGYELRHGRIASANAQLSRMEVLPRSRFRMTELNPVLSVAGGIAYEQGDLHQALRLNLRLMSIASLRGQMRLEASARRNISMILIAMNRLGPALASIERLVNPTLIGGQRPGAEGPALRATVLIEVGDLSGVLATLEPFLKKGGGGLSSFDTGNISSLLAARAFLAGESAEGGRHLSDALRVFSAAEAIDEIALLKLMEINLAPLEERRVFPGESAAGVAARAAEFEQRRVWRFAHWLEIRESGWPVDRKLALLKALRRELREAGEALLELDVLHTEASLEAEAGDAVAAADTLRDAMKLLREAADGLAPFPGLRETYLADPRRQRFLVLARSLNR